MSSFESPCTHVKSLFGFLAASPLLNISIDTLEIYLVLFFDTFELLSEKIPVKHVFTII